MGLFDKLKSAVGNAIESGIIGPMDENEKKYYDIVLNLLLSVRHLQKTHIQKFIEVKYGEKCEESTLDKVLEKFEAVEEPQTNKIWYRLTSVQGSRASYNGKTSWFNKEEIYDICFADFPDQIRLKFKEVCEVVKENPTKSILDQAVSQVRKTCPSEFPDYGEYSYYEMATKTIGQEIVKLFHAGESFIQELIGNEALSWLKYDYDKNNRGYISHLYALVLRAFHFEKTDKVVKDYTSITQADCREVATFAKVYQKEIKEKPFDKDIILDSATEAIFKCHIITAGSKSNWMYWVAQDTKLIDTACYMTWKKIADQYEDTAETVEDAVLMVNEYIVEHYVEDNN